MTRVVIAHDYLAQRGGAERVVLSLLHAFPDARVVTSLYEPSQTFAEFEQYRIDTSFLNRVSAIRQDARRGLPLLSTAWSSLSINDADVVICSSSGWSHAVRTSAWKVVYCHNPARWLYQSDAYLRDASTSVRVALSAMAPALRHWDQVQASTADLYLANSSTVRERIRRTYGYDAPVLHPPTGVDAEGERSPVPGLAPGFILTVGRPRSYKNTEAVCAAVASQPQWRLAVVGGLPEGDWPDNVQGITDATDAQLRWLYANCQALVAVGDEDFGLTVPEAASFGKPAVAWRHGGYLDTVVPGVNGVLIDSPTADQIVAGLRRLTARPPSTQAVLEHSRQFSEQAFVDSIQTLVHTGTLDTRTRGRRDSDGPAVAA